jgi:osmoprotectant transport system permease protein
MQYLNFILNPRNDYLGHTITYLQICGFSIVLAIVIGIVLGAAVSRNALLAFIAVNLSGLMRAIPIIAVLIVFVPIFGLGFTPTVNLAQYLYRNSRGRSRHDRGS